MSSSKRPMFFYVNLAKKLLAEHGEIQLSALGQGECIGSPMPYILRLADTPPAIAARHLPLPRATYHCRAAISTLVNVAEILKKDQLAVEKSKWARVPLHACAHMISACHERPSLVRNSRVPTTHTVGWRGTCIARNWKEARGLMSKVMLIHAY